MSPLKNLPYEYYIVLSPGALVLREHCVLNRKAYLSYGLFVFLFMFLFLLGGKKWSAEDGSLMVGQKLLLLFMVLFTSVSQVCCLCVICRDRPECACPHPAGDSFFSFVCRNAVGGIVVPLA